MNIEQITRLEAQVSAAEAAEAEFPFVGRMFAELRAELYRQMEDNSADMGLIRAKLIVMREIEGRFRAAINAGNLALCELKGGK